LDTSALLRQGQELLAQRKARDAATVARRILLLEPYSERGNVLLAYALIGQDRGGEARLAAEKALSLEPADAEAQVAIAAAWVADRRLIEAEAAARAAIELDPELANAHYVLGIALELQKSKTDAERQYEIAVELDPANDSAAERLWLASRAPLLGALSFASFVAFEAARGLLFNGRISYQFVALILLVVTAAFVGAVLVGKWRQRRRLARLTPYARTIVALQDRRPPAQALRQVLLPTAVVTAVIVSLSALTVLFALGWRATVNLHVGDCFTTDTHESVQKVTTIPCQLPHDAEVYAVLTDPAPPGAPYPGLAAVHASAHSRCNTRYESYVGVPFDANADKWVQTWVPEQSYWDVNIRTLYCALADPEGGQLTGSLRRSP
jgi:hypothetical protein